MKNSTISWTCCGWLRLPAALRILLAVNLVGLATVAVWFRCHSLGNVPGVNGDEAWYGVKAMEVLDGRGIHVVTPTGNPTNWLFLGPVVLLHVFFSPSIALLRWVACAGGLAALAINWWLCRWVFDRTTAIVSTLLLALLPLNIAYSRFAWDASQSLAATLPVLYFSLAAVRFPQRWRRHLLVAVVVQFVAVLVHPTNLLAAVAIAAAAATQLRREWFKRPAVVAGLALAVLLSIAAVAIWARGSDSSRFTQRMGDVGQLFDLRDEAHFSLLYPRLFTGGTIYRYISGSRSWFEWPGGDASNGWGADAVLFWLAMAAAVWSVARSRGKDGRREDRVLLWTWGLGLIGFLLVAGQKAMSPGWERWSVCLIGPAAVLATRGLLSLRADSPRRRHLATAAALLVGWLVLADFQANYFAFIERTGGRSHETFRTGAVEPKAAAIRTVLEEGGPGPTFVVSSEWHIYWPLRHLATSDKDVRVVNLKEAASDDRFPAAVEQGRVWYAEFEGSEALSEVEATLAPTGFQVRRRTFEDYSGRPVLHLLRRGEPSEPNQSL